MGTEGRKGVRADERREDAEGSVDHVQEACGERVQRTIAGQG